MLGARWGVGSAARGTVALGVLVCGCVFAAVAGPALNLHTRTQALQQDLAAQGDTAQSVQASVGWSDWVGPSEQGGGPINLLTVALLSATTKRIARSLAATPLPLAGGDWAGLSTTTLSVASGFAASAMAGAGSSPRLEVVYRDPLTANARVVAGSYSAAEVPAGALPPGSACIRAPASS